jgi:hypothetical protein
MGKGKHKDCLSLEFGQKIPAIRLGNRTYRIPEKAIITYLKQMAYEHYSGHSNMPILLLPNAETHHHI